MCQFPFFFCWRHVFCYQCKNMYMIEVSSEQSRSQFIYIYILYFEVYAYRVLLPLLLLLLLCVAILLLLLRQQCCCFLPLFVIVCRIAKFVAGSLHLIQVFSFSSSSTTIFSCIPLGSTLLRRICGLDLCLYTCILGNCGHARSQGGRQPAACTGTPV